jgi:hypothetical protein
MYPCTLEDSSRDSCNKVSWIYCGFAIHVLIPTLRLCCRVRGLLYGSRRIGTHSTFIQLLDRRSRQPDGRAKDCTQLASALLGRHRFVSIRRYLPRLSSRIAHVRSSEARVDDAGEPQ